MTTMCSMHRFVLHCNCITWIVAGAGSLGDSAFGAPCSHPADASARLGLQPGSRTCTHVPPPQGKLILLLSTYALIVDSLLCSRVWRANHWLHIALLYSQLIQTLTVLEFLLTSLYGFASLPGVHAIGVRQLLILPLAFTGLAAAA